MELDVAVKGIISVRKRITKEWGNPVNLSDLANKLANYNAYLGDHLGELEEERESKRGKQYMHYLKQGLSATAAENNSRAETAELHGQILKLRLMHRDAETQISMIQSRLKVLENKLRGDY